MSGLDVAKIPAKTCSNFFLINSLILYTKTNLDTVMGPWCNGYLRHARFWRQPKNTPGFGPDDGGSNS